MFAKNIPFGWISSTAINAFILNYAAYFAEIFHISSIPTGRYEAAEVLKFTPVQTDSPDYFAAGCKNCAT